MYICDIVYMNKVSLPPTTMKQPHALTSCVFFIYEHITTLYAMYRDG